VLASYEALLVEPHGGDLAGCFILRGEPERLAQLRGSAAFQRLSLRAAFVVGHYRVVSAVLGEALNHRLAQYAELAAAQAEASRP
jgi:hypothetical protein